MKASHSMVVSMRLPMARGNHLKRMANRCGWTASDASAPLVEEGLRQLEFPFIDFRESAAGRQAYVQGSSVAVWEVILLVRRYNVDVPRVARHLRWSERKVRAAINYAGSFPEEVQEALAENESVDFKTLKHMAPQAVDFVCRNRRKG